MRLILASSSPRRRELLAAAGVSFEIQPVDVDEQPLAGETPDRYVRRLAAEKAARVFESAGRSTADLLVLGADTAVVLDGAILGKPADDAEARGMLERLSGRAHTVLTGVSLRGAGAQAGAVEETGVWFSPLSEADIAWYVGTGEGRDKAGGYAIQGLASRFVPRIEGSYSNVVGLPVATVFTLFTRLGHPPPAVASHR